MVMVITGLLVLALAVGVVCMRPQRRGVEAPRSQYPAAAGELVIPREYFTDEALQVPQQQTMYHLPRLQRAPMATGR